MSVTRILIYLSNNLNFTNGIFIKKIFSYDSIPEQKTKNKNENVKREMKMYGTSEIMIFHGFWFDSVLKLWMKTATHALSFLKAKSKVIWLRR